MTGFKERRPVTNTKAPELIVKTASTGVTLKAKVGIEGQLCEFVVDTGSNITLVRPEKVGVVAKSKVMPVEAVLRTVAGTTMPVKGKGKLDLRIAGHNLTHDVWIADIVEDGIIGLDFLIKHNCQVDLVAKILRLGNDEIPLYESTLSSELTCRRVFATRTLSIPGRSEAILPGTMGESNVGTTWGSVGPTAGEETTSELMVGRVLVDTTLDVIPVRVLNLSDGYVTIKEGTHIAICEPVESVTKMTLCKERARRDPVDMVHDVPDHLKDLFERSRSCLDENCTTCLCELLVEFQDVFSKGPHDLGGTSVVTHEIDVGDAKPIRQHPRRLPFKQREEVAQMTKEMKEQGVIEESNSPWSSPVVLVRKKDGTQRFCVDYRKLNSITKKDSYPLPRIDATLDALGGSAWFSTLHLKSGYWQVKMKETDKEKTAFTAGEGLWQFRVMPFGLSNAPATFERLMENVLRGLPWTVCLIYLDDVIVHAKTIGDEFNRLREVFSRLRSVNLKLNPKKCNLFQREVRYLGHMVTKDGVTVDPAKTDAVRSWPTPKNKTEVRSFLGLCSYYRRFVRNFAAVAKALYELTEKDKEFYWTSDCQSSFENLKELLTSVPILAYPTRDGKFILDTDASGAGIGAVLSQEQNGQEKVIAYYSRVLNRSERNYCVTRRELLAVICSIEQFNCYLYGQVFTIRTDHSALQWIAKFRNPEGQIARWLQKLQTYQFEVAHRPGVSHKNADTLSRRPCAVDQCKYCDTVEQKENTTNYVVGRLRVTPELERRSEEFVLDHGTWVTEQSKDESLAPILTAIKNKKRPEWIEISPSNPETKTFWAQWDSLRLEGHLLYRCWEDAAGTSAVLQLVVPRALRKQVFGFLHNSKTGGHFGITKTLGKIKEKFYWPKCRYDVQTWCGQCEECNSRKGPTRKIKAPLRTYVVGSPMERVAIDVLGPLPTSESGNKYLLIAMDYFTKWPEAYPLPNQEAITVADVLVKEFVSRFGVPVHLHSDQGRNFESQVFGEMCKILGMKKTRTTPLHPQSDGMVERYNRTLEHQLAIFVNENQRDWDEHIPLLLMAYRTAIHESTGITPAKMMMGRQLRLPLDLLMGPTPQVHTNCKGEYVEKLLDGLEVAHKFARTRLKLTSERMKTHYNLDATARKLDAGTAVWLYKPVRKKGISPKLTKPWAGPYIVIKRINDLVYRIRLNAHSKPMVVHRNRLRIYMGVTPPVSLKESGKGTPAVSQKDVKRKTDQTVVKNMQPVRRSERLKRQQQSR